MLLGKTRGDLRQRFFQLRTLGEKKFKELPRLSRLESDVLNVLYFHDVRVQNRLCKHIACHKVIIEDE